MRTVVSRFIPAVLIVMTYVVISQWSSSQQYASAHAFRLPLLQQGAPDEPGDRPWISLDDMAGKPVLLNFWASWCEVCRTEKPHLRALWEKHGGKTVQIVGIATSDTATAVLQSGLHDRPYPIALDGDGQVLQAYGRNAVPQSFLIDRHGHIVHHVIGPLAGPQLAALEAKLTTLNVQP